MKKIGYLILVVEEQTCQFRDKDAFDRVVVDY